MQLAGQPILMRAMQRRFSPPVSGLALWSQRLAFLALLMAAVGLYVGRTGAVPLLPSMAVIGSALFLSSLATVLAVAAFVVIWRVGAKGLGSAYAGLVLAFLLLAYPAYLAVLSLTLPVLADVSTDFSAPPSFSPSRQAVARRGNYTPPGYDASLAAAQRAAYPGVQPVLLELGVDESFRLVQQALQQRRWTIVESVGPQRARDDAYVEAIDRSLLLRIPEDIVIRLRAVGDETRIDMRSASRIGRHDFGANARRIESLVGDLVALAKDR